jgi:hypothetical protein
MAPLLLSIKTVEQPMRQQLENLTNFSTFATSLRFVLFIGVPAVFLFGAVTPTFVLILTQSWWLFVFIMASIAGDIWLVRYVFTHRYVPNSTEWETYLRHITARDLWKLSPQQFEELVVWLFTQTGFALSHNDDGLWFYQTKTRLTGQLRIIQDNTPIALESMLQYIQSSADVDQNWWIVTRRAFPTPARLLAAQTNVELVDGPRLIHWAKRFNTQLGHERFAAALEAAERAYLEAA